jgi:hypothetical protein
LTNAQKRELEFREGFLTDDPGAILFNVMNFKGLELLIGTYSVHGERTVRKLVNVIREADAVTGVGIHPSMIDRLRESECDTRVVGEFRRRFIEVYHEFGIIDGIIVYVDGHFKPYWGNVSIPKGFSTLLNKPMKGIYEFFGHDANGNAICSIELPGDACLLDGTDFIKREIVAALGPGYAKLLIVDREGMSGEQLEKYEDETRSILGILRTSSNVPNYRVHETIEEGKKKAWVCIRGVSLCKNFKSKKGNGDLDTLHGYDFYEVENRQHENWLKTKESNMRGHERSINARKREISRLKKKEEGKNRS